MQEDMETNIMLEKEEKRGGSSSSSQDFYKMQYECSIYLSEK